MKALLFIAIQTAISTSLPAITIQQNKPLNDKNWFKTGGPAKYYCEPKNIHEFQEALEYAQTKNVDVFVLGEGAHVLISDNGFNGLVIRPKIKNITHYTSDNHAYVTASAGNSVHELITYCLNNNISGLEDLSGIPGSIGGALNTNMHYLNCTIGNFVSEITMIEKKSGKIVKTTWPIQNKKKYFILDATFKLKIVSDIKCAYYKGQHDELIRHRNRMYPTSNTCGFFFKNFKKAKLGNNKMPYIIYYLDKLGLRGNLSFGGATISYKHPNMLINKTNATTTDIINLARKIQKIIYEKFGITPQPECQLIGFKEYPLLK